jgi:hypothetical protein
MMKGRWLTLIALASLCLNLAVVGTYLYRQSSRHGFRRPRMLGVKPDIQEHLRQIREQAWPQFKELAVKAESANSALLEKIDDPDVTEAQVESLCREVGKFHGAMRERVFWQTRRELDALPAELRPEYVEQLKHRMKRMMRGPARHGPGAFGPHSPTGELPPGDPPPEPPCDGPPPDLGR